MTDLAWEAPPPPKRAEWPPIFAALMERPGEWAKVRFYATAKSAGRAVSDIRSGRHDTLPDGEWEACSRSDGRGAWVYVRYLGVNKT